jgi:cardiolipin synthase
VRQIPNIISILRILLVIPTGYFLWEGRYHYALLVFLIAGVSDGLDGALARRYGWTTRLGMILDPLGDKLLLTVSYLMLGLLDRLPTWLVALVIGRDVFISVGALVYRWWIEDVPMSPLLVSKINTAVQIALVLLLIYQLSSLPAADMIPTSFIKVMIFAVALTTASSGLAYFVVWGRRALFSLRARQSS